MELENRRRDCTCLGEVRVQVAKTVDEVESIRPEWQAIQADAENPEVNADIDRYLSFFGQHGKTARPHVFLARRNSDALAMVVGRIETRPIEFKVGYKTLLAPRLRFLTIIYGGVLGSLSGDLCSLLAGELQKALQNRVADAVFFNRLSVDSPLHELVRTVPMWCCRDLLPKRELHWSMAVPDNIEAFYAARSKKHRANLKRNLRKLESQFPNQVNVVTYHAPDELDEAIQAICAISPKTYQQGLGHGFDDSERTRHMLRVMAEKGWLRLSVLYVAGEPSAYQIGLTYGKTYKLEQIGFDPEWGYLNVGTVLFLRVLEMLCRHPSVDTFDFGFGNAEYKQRYGDRHWDEVSTYIFAPRPYPVFVNALRALTTALSAVARTAFDRVGMSGRLKRYWRRRLSAETRCSEP